ncbi:hypothetical protein DRO33_01270, partial [Candidatus Bathyarchaeota archaeon]
MEETKLMGICLLAVGICLILFTFWCGYIEYRSVPHIEITTTDPWEAFTEALKYLIEPCVKVMFLGVMGWAGVILTNRGVQLMRVPAPSAQAPLPSPPVTPPPPP